jgi:hypothetical protein
MLKPTLMRGVLAVAAMALVSSGCRCGPPPSKINKGAITLVYVEDTTTKKSGSNTELANATYDFGQVPMGKKETLKVTIENSGLGTLSIASIEKDIGATGENDAVSVAGMGDPMPVFLFADFAQKDIGPGESADFVVTFDSPTENAATVDHQSQLIVRATNTEPGFETAKVTVKGKSVSGECELPAVLDFGAVSRGDSFDIATKIKNTRPIDAIAFIGDITSNSGDEKAFTFTPDSPKGDVSLKTGQEKTVTISFAPTEIHDYLARVTMRRLDGCPDKIVKLIGSGVDAVLTWSPACNLDNQCPSNKCTNGACAVGDFANFGYVTPGLSVNKDIVFSNLGLKDVTLNTLAASPADFKSVTMPPVTVPAAMRDATSAMLVPGTVKVTALFKPTLLGPRNNGRLDFTTSLVKQPSGTQLLHGYGGGPDIDVKPPTINFGRVAWFNGANPPAYATRKLTIQNVGTRPTPPDNKANLHLGAAGTGTVYWDVAVKAGVANNTATLGEICVGAWVNNACSNQPTTGSYDPVAGLEAFGTKALLDVPLRVTPTGIGIKEWEVTIHSDDPDEADFKVTIHAESIELPPCNYDITPLNLNFGLITPPAYKDLAFTITNKSQVAGEICLVSNLDIRAGSDAIFSLPAGPVSDTEIQPGAQLVVAVRAWPQGTVPASVTTVSGYVDISISNPMKPLATVSLNGTIAASCLTISPSDLNFGTVQKDCSSATRTFSVYNTCSAAVKINSYSMVSPGGEPAGGPNCPGASACPEFIAVSTAGIAPNTMIQPGATPATFTMKYHPINYGTDNGAFLLKVTQNGTVVDYIVTLTGNGDTMGLNTDTFKQDSKPKADILLIIDDSGSMFDKQQSLSVNFSSFIKYATSAQVDYQIGVTTTDMDLEGGRIVGDASNPKILKPTTPNVENLFKAKVNVGTNGSATETSLDVAVAALTNPLITTDNAGLLRADAVLAVVVVSDADDQAPLAVSYYVNQLLNIKGAQHASQFSFNIVGPTLASPPSGCSYDTPGPRSATAVTATNGVKEEICTTDWSKALEAIGKQAFGYRTNFYLTATPDLTAGKTIVVKIDGVQLDPVDIRGAQVWTYDSTGNSVNFEPLFVPEPGKTLSITYFVSCIP